MRWLDDTAGSMDMSLSKLWETVKTAASCSPCGYKESDVTWRLSNSAIVMLMVAGSTRGQHKSVRCQSDLIPGWGKGMTSKLRFS